MVGGDRINHGDAQHVHMFAYVGPVDPGAVGAKKGWVDTSVGPPYTLRVRNLANTGWDDVGGVGGGSALTVEELDGTPTDAAVVKLVLPNGTLAIAGHVATYTPVGVAATTRWELLTNGDPDDPEFIFAGGDAIYVEVPV